MPVEKGGVHTIRLVMVVGLPKLRAVLQQFQNVLEILFGLLFVGLGLRIFWEVLMR